MHGRPGTRCASRGRQASPATSNNSELSMMSRSPSPASITYTRQPSPALSDSTELSVLSRSPSPPPGLVKKIESSPGLNLPTRRPNRRFLGKTTKRMASPTPATRLSKRTCVLPPSTPKVVKKKTLANPRSPRSTRSPRSPVALKASVVVTEVKGAGYLDRLPREIRQTIYAYCLSIHEPVSIKQCCGPTYTSRARASCKKHGEHCSKIGRGNGLLLYEEDEGGAKAHGRFSILSVSRSVNEEASWVLYTQGTLTIQSTPALQAYLGEKQCTFFRLPNLPATDCIERMWLSAARFRRLCFKLPWTKMSVDDPVECIYRLYEAVAFLMKAWDLLKEKPSFPRTVELQLQALYTAILPFNSKTSAKMAYEWTAFHQPHLGDAYIADFDSIGEEVVNILERLVDLVGRHGGQSRWKVVAKTPRGYTTGNTEDYKSDTMEFQENKGFTGLFSLEDCCRTNGIEFVAMG